MFSIPPPEEKGTRWYLTKSPAILMYWRVLTWGYEHLLCFFWGFSLDNLYSTHPTIDFRKRRALR